MIKKSFFSLAVFFCCNILYAQPGLLEGHWEGAISRLGSVQLLKFNFIRVADSVEIQYDDPARGVYTAYLDIEKKLGKSDSVFDINFGYGQFHCLLNKQYMQITGTNKSWNPAVLFHIKKQGAKEADPYTAEDILIANPPVTLAGTIYKPKNVLKYPMVVLLHGSDVQTRRTWYIRSLIYILTKNGIGITVYDKRGTGMSGGNMDLASFTDFANDALACIQYLSKRKDLPIEDLGLFGTSAGGWISAMVANKTNKLDFAILNVGPAVSTYQQELDRVEYSLRGEGADEKIIDSAIRHTKLYFAVVTKNNGWDKLQQSVELYKNRDWAIQVKLQLPQKMNDEDVLWWRSHYYDPASDLTHIKCRVLSIMGEKDNLVPPATNKTLMEKYLTTAGVRHKIIELPNAGHSGIAFQTLYGGEWKWPEHFWIWPERSQLYYEEIINWIKKRN